MLIPLSLPNIYHSFFVAGRSVLLYIALVQHSKNTKAITVTFQISKYPVRYLTPNQFGGEWLQPLVLD